MMNKPILGVAAVVALLVLFYAACTYTVSRGETVVVLSFGKPLKVVSEPGLNLRLPYPFNSLKRFDSRLLLLHPRPAEFLTADKKNLILESALCYRLTDPILFMKTVRDQAGLEIRLTDLLSSNTGLLLGHFELSDLINVNREKIQFEDLNIRLTALMKENSRNLGIRLERVFITRLTLPEVNRTSVYQRMRAERNRIAKKYIAEGEETAQKIRAEADSQSRMLIAEAERQATLIRGKAEAEAMKTYGDAYRQNREFYNFTRAMEFYRKVLGEKSTLVLDDESPLLKPLLAGE